MTFQASFIALPKSGAVLLDLDGTLANTDPLHAKAWRLIAQSYFGKTFTWEEYSNACINHGLSPVEFLMQLGIDARSKEIQTEKTTLFRRLMTTELGLAPGVKKFLDKVTSHGITVAIVSGGSRASVDAFLNTLWPGPAPAITVSRDDTAQHKPHPAPYNFALTQLRRRPADCVAIEDTDRGICSAHRAGLRSVLIQDESQPSAAPADLIAT